MAKQNIQNFLEAHGYMGSDGTDVNIEGTLRQILAERQHMVADYARLPDNDQGRLTWKAAYEKAIADIERINALLDQSNPTSSDQTPSTL